MQNIPGLNMCKYSTEIAYTFISLLDRNQECRIQISSKNLACNINYQKILVNSNRSRPLYGLIGSKGFKFFLENYYEFFPIKYKLKHFPSIIDFCSVFVTDIQTFGEKMIFLDIKDARPGFT